MVYFSDTIPRKFPIHLCTQKIYIHTVTQGTFHPHKYIHMGTSIKYTPHISG